MNGMTSISELHTPHASNLPVDAHQSSNTSLHNGVDKTNESATVTAGVKRPLPESSDSPKPKRMLVTAEIANEQEINQNSQPPEYGAVRVKTEDNQDQTSPASQNATPPDALEQEKQTLRDIVEPGIRDVETAKEMMKNSMENLFDIKMKELDLEEQLIKQGTHPDYLQELKDIEVRHNLRKQQARHRLNCAIQAYEQEYDAHYKRAMDTFKVLDLIQDQSA
ncbi:hypothetical protein EDD86DRAFT_204268 [Gorgonomyces haynaldii]|nr:hypothetical protein EDD86DRAFT_204268 [Gorgonomyces haynaldii]